MADRVHFHGQVDTSGRIQLRQYGINNGKELYERTSGLGLQNLMVINGRLVGVAFERPEKADIMTGHNPDDQILMPNGYGISAFKLR